MEVQMRIIFLFLGMSSSATVEVWKNLTGTEGGSITLPDPLVEHGFVSFGGNIIAMVNDGNILIYENIYTHRLLWNKNTGLCEITRLQRNDSGIYYINSKKGNIFTATYKLIVYESVPTPAVNTLSVSTESCALMCVVVKAEDTTLLWLKDDEIVNQSSSALSLPLTVYKQDFNSTYRCVAANPVENKTRPVNVTASCAGQSDEDRTDKDTRHRIFWVFWVVILIVSAVICILVAFLKRKCFNKSKRTVTQTQDSVSGEPDVKYTDIVIAEDRCSQGGNLPHSSADPSNLTTVYYKLEAHHMAPSHTDYTCLEPSNKLPTYVSD